MLWPDGTVYRLTHRIRPVKEDTLRYVYLDLRRICATALIAHSLPLMRRIRTCVGLLGLAAGASACITQEGAEEAVKAFSGGDRPDSLPVMLNESPPFLYPADLYAEKVQGNVTLRIFVDSTGTIVPESTSVATSSGIPGLDSAAVTGSERLEFAPAKKGPRPMATPVLLPVYFRHPEAAALPGDTVLRPRLP
jgi:TonB family protein